MFQACAIIYLHYYWAKYNVALSAGCSPDLISFFVSFYRCYAYSFWHGTTVPFSSTQWVNAVIN